MAPSVVLGSKWSGSAHVLRHHAHVRLNQLIMSCTFLLGLKLGDAPTKRGEAVGLRLSAEGPGEFAAVSCHADAQHGPVQRLEVGRVGGEPQVAVARPVERSAGVFAEGGSTVPIGEGV
jgi:hypothetical protein